MSQELTIKCDFKDDEHGIGSALSWASIGLAVLTAIFQGLVTALAFMTESSSRWTFRFRLALFEHIWWTFVSFLLLVSLSMSVVAFTGGEGGDPVSVLALSSATFLAVVQYSVPAWQHRSYTAVRWHAWTGDSRTTVKRQFISFCGDAALWKQLYRRFRDKISRLQPTPSDYYGWRLWSAQGLLIDPTDLFRVLKDPDVAFEDAEKHPPPVGIYQSADANSVTVSLRWGRDQDFSRRVSRAIASMPLCLLRSSPTTAEGYDGRGLTTAMGILGRNKGLQPWKLVFKATSGTTSDMENLSTWAPRPAKVLRSFYSQTMDTQYQGLGQEYVSAAVELALLMADMPSAAVIQWLSLGLEHQSLSMNHWLANTALATATPDERNATLSAHYESSYVSMIISLNAMRMAPKADDMMYAQETCRPDLICTALLMKARGLPEPSWWRNSDARDLVTKEMDSLSPDFDWKTSAAKLLGLQDWPQDLD
ncbi:hypothetical protein CLAFUW4_09567 [Fulvia fulva]|uniref:Uncharacterized protein n=1 Tax=Passalora fulva TaxID=5499 RepID=A0A9Q8PGG2_PASFU|nr:uncharacterized protein CLAFUR5_09662 [Fulvia fulva]KAK4613804.1 hypothetical protein CLAFUR4_09573 [Fulvia fulva]KAK4615118.1 hypothetical protein CLAFUR0_09564 [Fulvia fulva]UJO21965.1 hypothetical protein CLAFUR5_09662 [Fulvia fulva]WPV20316.1 hypothetical protein CLAFUW4_09567 [Fulvia fulva]WPV35461.1 hypothetical protein CLAFUW7_09568 [Fulvia fulva]